MGALVHVELRVPALAAQHGESKILAVERRRDARDATDNRLNAWVDGTAMTPLETTTVQTAAGSVVWMRVRDPRGDSGWVRQDYLRPTR